MAIGGVGKVESLRESSTIPGTFIAGVVWKLGGSQLSSDFEIEFLQPIGALELGAQLPDGNAGEGADEDGEYLPGDPSEEGDGSFETPVEPTPEPGTASPPVSTRVVEPIPEPELEQEPAPVSAVSQPTPEPVETEEWCEEMRRRIRDFWMAKKWNKIRCQSWILEHLGARYDSLRELTSVQHCRPLQPKYKRKLHRGVRMNWVRRGLRKPYGGVPVVQLPEETLRGSAGGADA